MSWSARKPAIPSKGSGEARPKSYFDEDDDEETTNFRPGGVEISRPSTDNDDDDPLDQFMAGVGDQIQKETVSNKIEPIDLPEIVSEADRDYEGYYDFLDQQRADGDSPVDYDSDGNPINPTDKKNM
jgi:ATP-dependent RNA helicase DDX42